jgi:hypothetical protein
VEKKIQTEIWLYDLRHVSAKNEFRTTFVLCTELLSLARERNAALRNDMSVLLFS